MSLWHLGLADFRDRTASDQPTPGGGSVAMVSASLGLGLVLMALRVSARRAEDSAALDPLILKADRLLNEISRHADADIDVFEFAEAFSALCLRFRRDLDAGPDRMNPNGGTMAMGHAFGATGAILVGSCLDAIERRG